MVHYHRSFNQLGKGEGLVYGFTRAGNEGGIVSFVRGNTVTNKRGRSRALFIAFLCLLSISLIWVSKLFGFPSTFSLPYPFDAQLDSSSLLCSSVSNGTICCDRTSIRTDICFMKGDVRTQSPSSSIILYATRNPRISIDESPSPTEERSQKFEDDLALQHEKIKPYTRKWETSVMNTIEELNLISKANGSGFHHKCDVIHDVPAVFFSTGGYTGNLYHEFNDGIIPLYITSQHFNKQVVFVILNYHNWWFTKYGDILSLLSDHQPIDFDGDNRTHCFPEAVVGLRIHDELTVDSSLMEGNKSIRDFRTVLDRAYRPRIRDLIVDEEREEQEKLQQQGLPLAPPAVPTTEKPKLTIVSRSGSRAVRNENAMVKLAEEIGFRVEILRPDRTTELAKIYRGMNSSDAMIGVHGAAMTHLLFLRPGCVFIQIIPLGTEWAAETYYGEPARKLGLKYVKYEILPRESSLYEDYEKDDPVLRDPSSVAKKGWEFTKKIYLDNQTVVLDLRRFGKRLVGAYEYSMGRRRKGLHQQMLL